LSSLLLGWSGFSRLGSSGFLAPDFGGSGGLLHFRSLVTQHLPATGAAGATAAAAATRAAAGLAAGALLAAGARLAAGCLALVILLWTTFLAAGLLADLLDFLAGAAFLVADLARAT